MKTEKRKAGNDKRVESEKPNENCENCERLIKKIENMEKKQKETGEKEDMWGIECSDPQNKPGNQKMINSSCANHSVSNIKVSDRKLFTNYVMLQEGGGRLGYKESHIELHN